jgi:hypothetical protein
VRELNPTAPPKLEHVINKALEKDREQRYQHASEIRAELELLVSSNKPRRTGVRWGLAVGGVTALLLLAGVGLWWVKRQPSIPRVPPALKQRQLTANTNDNPVRDEVISQDGTLLSYSDNKGLHVKSIATGDNKTLETPEALKGMHVEWATGPWFHDGTRFLVTAMAAGRRPSTWVFSLVGGAARKLRDDADTQEISPDGSLLAFTTNPGKLVTASSGSWIPMASTRANFGRATRTPRIQTFTGRRMANEWPTSDFTKRQQNGKKSWRAVTCRADRPRRCFRRDRGGKRADSEIFSGCLVGESSIFSATTI